MKSFEIMEDKEQVKNELISINFSCVNCNMVFVVSERAILYCSPRCQQDAKLVRYFRSCLKDGRINDPLVRKAIQTRIGFANTEKGYYDEKARSLSVVLRKKVLERDKGLCRNCGAVGSEIDHINGNSNDIDNLQLLCNDCHTEKTQAGIIHITLEHPRYEEIQTRNDELRSRINAPIPLRLCDDELKWNETYQQIMAGQRQLLKQIKEDIEGVSENRDLLIEETVIQELSELNELHSQIEVLKMQKQAEIDKILTPEILAQIEAIETDFSDIKQVLSESILTLERRIKEAVKKYGLKIKGNDLQAVFRKGSVGWDTKALEEYSKIHPEILQFRKEGKNSVIIMNIKKK